LVEVSGDAKADCGGKLTLISVNHTSVVIRYPRAGNGTGKGQGLQLIQNNRIAVGVAKKFTYNVTAHVTLKSTCSCMSEEIITISITKNVTIRQVERGVNLTLYKTQQTLGLDEARYFNEKSVKSALKEKASTLKSNMAKSIQKLTCQKLLNRKTKRAVLADPIQQAIDSDAQNAVESLDGDLSSVPTDLASVLPKEFCAYEGAWGVNSGIGRCICPSNATASDENPCHDITKFFGTQPVNGVSYFDSICHPVVCHRRKSGTFVLMSKLTIDFERFDHFTALGVVAKLRELVQARKKTNGQLNITRIEPCRPSTCVHFSSTEELNDDDLRVIQAAEPSISELTSEDSTPYGLTVIEQAVIGVIIAAVLLVVVLVVVLVFKRANPVILHVPEEEIPAYVRA
jgi:hypothetical protein